MLDARGEEILLVVVKARFIIGRNRLFTTAVEVALADRYRGDLATSSLPGVSSSER